MTLKEFLDRLEQENSNKILGDVYVESRNNCVLWLLKKGKTKDKDVAKDIFTNAVLILLKNAKNGKIEASDTKVETYLMTTCRYIQSNLNKRKGKPVEWDLDDLLAGITEENPDLAIDKEALLVRVEETMARLKEPCATLFRLHYYEGYSYREIAEMLGYASEDVVKTMFYRCKKTFRDLFGDLF